MTSVPAESGHSADPFEAGSTAYRDAGAALRQVHARARELHLTGAEWRVLSVVIDLTVARSKLCDRTHRRFVAEAAGFGSELHQVKRAGRVLGRLKRLGLIEYTPGSNEGRRWTVVGLPPPVGSGDRSPYRVHEHSPT